MRLQESAVLDWFLAKHLVSRGFAEDLEAIYADGRKLLEESGDVVGEDGWNAADETSYFLVSGIAEKLRERNPSVSRSLLGVASDPLLARWEALEARFRGGNLLADAAIRLNFLLELREPSLLEERARVAKLEVDEFKRASAWSEIAEEAKKHFNHALKEELGPHTPAIPFPVQRDHLLEALTPAKQALDSAIVSLWRLRHAGLVFCQGLEKQWPALHRLFLEEDEEKVSFENCVIFNGEDDSATAPHHKKSSPPRFLCDLASLQGAVHVLLHPPPYVPSKPPPELAVSFVPKYKEEAEILAPIVESFFQVLDRYNPVVKLLSHPSQQPIILDAILTKLQNIEAAFNHANQQSQLCTSNANRHKATEAFLTNCLQYTRSEIKSCRKRIQEALPSITIVSKF